MARPKEFSPEEVLAKATHLFWRNGYEATSIEDLVREMGINRGSLYETFGDKHQLFLACLKQYCSGMAERHRKLEEPGPALPALREYFMGLTSLAGTDAAKRGCLIVNTVMELAPHEKDTGKILTQALTYLEETFYRVLLRAQAQGELKPHHEPRSLARFLATLLQGGAVMLKSGATPKAMEDIVKTGLSVLN